MPDTEDTFDHMGVWCCSKTHNCTWQGFALHRGLAWGKVPSRTVWREYHDRHCEGRLIQLLNPGIAPNPRVELNSDKNQKETGETWQHQAKEKRALKRALRKGAKLQIYYVWR
jgi:hypothetical protein